MAGIAAASLFAAPLSGVASASQMGAARLHVNAAQFQAHYAKLLPFAGFAPANHPVKLMVHLPLRNRAELQSLVKQMSTPKSPLYHKYLTHAQFAARYAPLASDMQSAAAALRAGGFTVSKIDPQFIYVNAPSATVERFFGTKMGLVRDGNVLHVDARTPIVMPAALTKLNASIIGLKGRMMLHPEHMVRAKHGVRLPKAPKGQRDNLHPQAFYGPQGPYFPGELLQAYGEPSYTFANGAGTSIAIVGYSDSTDYDNQNLWCYYGLGQGCGFGGTLGNYPTVNHYEAVGSIPPNLDDNGLEASLDAQIAGGSAPGATIDQYASDAVSNFGFLDTYAYIASYSGENYVTTSYGECELDYYFGYVPFYTLQAYDDTFLQGASYGISFLFSSGDSGAFGCAGEGYSDALVSFPASDPNVTAVGGTTLLATNYLDAGFGTTYNYEQSNSYGTAPNVWGSGGGTSILFETPDYQLAIGLPDGGSYGVGPPYGTGRQVPDVSMHMGGPSSFSMSSDWIYSSLYGGFVPVIGTSASSPEYAGYMAQLVTGFNAAGGGQNPYLGNSNYIWYLIEQEGAGPIWFNQGICGDNGYYVTDGCFGPSYYGYNQVLGLGTPNLQSTAANFWGKVIPPAGDTYTTSNP